MTVKELFEKYDGNTSINFFNKDAEYIMNVSLNGKVFDMIKDYDVLKWSKDTCAICVYIDF